MILDSGFCVLDEMLALKQYGVFSSALIKKRRYWPAGIPAEAIRAFFSDMAVGDHHRLTGEKQGIKFDVFAHKEPDYITMLMSTYGALIERPNQKESVRSWRNDNNETIKKYFRCKEVIASHYLFRGSVYSHNRWRHDANCKLQTANCKLQTTK